MSNYVLNWVFQHSESTGNDRLVLIAIADEADDDGTHAYPGIRRLATKTRINERTVMRCLVRLEERGELAVKHPEKVGRGHHNTYAVLMRKPDTLTGFPEAEIPRNGDNGEDKDREKARTPSQFVTDPLTHTAKAVDPQTQTRDPFDDFWDVYPRKANKPDARKAWNAAMKAGNESKTLIDGASRLRSDPNRVEKFTPYPASWIRGEQWNDPPLPSPLNLVRSGPSQNGITGSGPRTITVTRPQKRESNG